MGNGKPNVRLLWACGVFAMLMAVGAFLVARLNGHQALGGHSENSLGANEVRPSAVEETGEGRVETKNGGSTFTNSPVQSVLEVNDYFRSRLGKLSTPATSCPFLKSSVTSVFTKADLPSLYAALRNDELAWQWKDILFAICVLDDGPKALKATQDLISTPWDWKSNSRRYQDPEHVIANLIIAISTVGVIDSSLSGPVLKDLFTQEGAESFLANWRETASAFGPEFFDHLTCDLMYGAGYGLLHSRTPELFKIVEDRYAEIKAIPVVERSKEERVVIETCTGLMHLRDFYDKRGWDEGIREYYSLSPSELLSWRLRVGNKYPL